MIKIVILSLSLFVYTFGYNYPTEKIHKDIDTLFSIVSDTHDIKINNNIFTLDMRRLLIQTAMIESNFARDKYRGRVAKTYMQIEKDTAKWYLSRVSGLRNYIEMELGRKLTWDKDEDAMFVVYLLYMSKIFKHSKILNNEKYLEKYFKNHYDVDYYIYKLLYNSIKGKSTYEKWLSRERQYIRMLKESEMYEQYK